MGVIKNRKNISTKRDQRLQDEGNSSAVNDSRGTHRSGRTGQSSHGQSAGNR